MKKDLDYYMSLNYYCQIMEDPLDGGYVAYFPDLPGCITYADTLSELEKMITDAKKCWFTACLEDKQEIPEPSFAKDVSGQFKIRLPKSLHAQLIVEADREGISMNQYCVHLLSKGVNRITTKKI